MNKRQKFENFLESFKGNGQDKLIESVKKGFQVCFEMGEGKILEQEQQNNISNGFVITKWTKYVTDDNMPVTIRVKKPDTFTTPFRLLDDDENVYFYGYQDQEKFDPFSPLDGYGLAYGCTELQYKENGTWKTL